MGATQIAYKDMRPVRLSKFVLTCVASDEVILNDQICGEVGFISDVHYCTEKSAIDTVNGRIEEFGDRNPELIIEYKYLIYKVSKELDENGEYKSVQLVESLWGDPDTLQCVIE